MTQQDQFLAFIARLCLVLLFPFSALNKIFDHQSAMAQAAQGWIPLPPSVAALLLVLGGMLELIGPVCILLGIYRRQAALDPLSPGVHGRDAIAISPFTIALKRPGCCLRTRNAFYICNA